MDRKKREEKVGYRSISRRVLRQNWEYIYKARIEKYIYTTDASSSDKDRCGGINIKHEIISTRAQPTCPDGFFPFSLWRQLMESSMINDRVFIAGLFALCGLVRIKIELVLCK